MNAAIIYEYSGLDEVTVREFEPEEVLVPVTAASVDPLDPEFIIGNVRAFFPFDLSLTVGSGAVEAPGCCTYRRG